MKVFLTRYQHRYLFRCKKRQVRIYWWYQLLHVAVSDLYVAETIFNFFEISLDLKRNILVYICLIDFKK